jgi:hypothetical protein
MKFLRVGVRSGVASKVFSAHASSLPTALPSEITISLSSPYNILNNHSGGQAHTKHLSHSTLEQLKRIAQKAKNIYEAN